MARQRRPATPSGQFSDQIRPNTPQIDFLILADAAEAVNGKIYMLGGAFDRLVVPDFGQPVGFSIALALVVPWTATNSPHNVSLALETADGTPVQDKVSLAFNVGRPPTAEAGQSFRACVAVRSSFKLPGPGTYVLSAELPGAESRRAVFYASSPNMNIGFPPGFVPGLPPV